MSNESKPVEAGPEPTQRPPLIPACITNDPKRREVSAVDRFGLEVFTASTERNAAALRHRFNNWDALIAERDAALERVAELEAQLAEADACIANTVERTGLWMADEEERAIARHRARQEGD